MAGDVLSLQAIAGDIPKCFAKKIRLALSCETLVFCIGDYSHKMQSLIFSENAVLECCLLLLWLVVLKCQDLFFSEKVKKTKNNCTYKCMYRLPLL